ncbi:MAG: hypothetical protein LH606_15700 [Cytophagaceae bacterium]|nr:hypothetical protein [Cytophagaceae bacterium]
MTSLEVEWLEDWSGKPIRLTTERKSHLLDAHPELVDYVANLQEVVGTPDLVRQSVTDPQTRLYYREYETKVIGTKWLCVVVKISNDDAFVITAYFKDALKKGAELWTKS